MEGTERRGFVGRGPELARLETALAATTAGHGRTVVIGGEAGIGKSRLLEAFEFRATAAGARVLLGACLDAQLGGIPYAPFVEILRDLIRATPEGRLPALLGPARGEIARLLPELAPRAADLPPASEGDRAARARLFELLLGVFERLAGEAPLVLAVEDIQWADAATRELLGFLARGLRDDRALLLLTLRTDAGGRPAGNLAFVAELERDDDVDRFDLRPFGRDEVDAQLEAVLGRAATPAELDRILARSDGNPFFVEELAASTSDHDDLPAVLRDVLTARVAGLSPGTQAALRAAAVGGRFVDDELLAAVTGAGSADLAAALREGVAAGVLVRDDARPGRPLAFRHALVLEAVDGELFGVERAGLHGAYATALESRAATARRQPALPAAPGDLARHWDAAGEAARAIPPMVEAAKAAERGYAFADAERWWSRAAELGAAEPEALAAAGVTRDEALGRAADAAALAGDASRAVELGREAIAAVDGAVDPERAGRLHDRQRWYLWEAGDRRAAAGAVEEALRLLPVEPPTVARARALAQHAGIQLYAGEYEAAIRSAKDAIQVARAAGGPGEEALALGVMGWCEAVLGDPEAGIARFREGQAIAVRLESVEGIALAAFNLTSLLDRIGRSAESGRAAAEGYALTERLGVARSYGGLLLGYEAKADFLLGRWDEAAAAARLGLRRGATDRSEIWLATNLARVLVARGELVEARSLLVRARATESRLGGTEFASPLLTAEAELALAEGRRDDLRRAAAAGIELATKPGPPDPSLAWLAATVLRGEADAVAAARAASTLDAASVAAIVERIGRATEAAAGSARELLKGSPRGIALLQLLRAERARLEGRDDAATWDAVAGAFDTASRPYPAAYARFRAAARILASRGDRRAAQDQLRAAAAGATLLSARPLLAEIEALGRQARLELGSAAGPADHAGQPDTADALGLTEREREVLRLVAGGWTNQQIADALFITRKTASVHVSNVMAKLGVEGRTAAAAVAHRLGLAIDPPAPPESAA